MAPLLGAARHARCSTRRPSRARRGCSGRRWARASPAAAAGCRPLIARDSLAASLVDPALRCLRAARRRGRLRPAAARDRPGGRPRQRPRLRPAPDRARRRATRSILALPPGQTGALLPEIAVPRGQPRDRQRPFPPGAAGAPAGRRPLLGPGRRHRGMAVRARRAGQPDGERRRRAGRRAERGDRGAPVGGHRARARPAARSRSRRCGSSRSGARPSPRRRQRPPGGPLPRPRWPNLLLAGDWTATGLPATIEGAIRSGDVAADLVVKQTETKAR